MICRHHVALNDPPTAMTIAATWIFPLAILLSLPFESVRKKAWYGNLSAISNWLGSPQTALTATIFNVIQIHWCYREPRPASTEDDGKMWTDAFYVLSCFNQYRLPAPTNDPNHDFLLTLVYGLLRPLSNGRLNENQIDLNEAGQEEPDELDRREIQLTKELLSALAFQLRVHRRRSILPMLASLGIFIAAFGFSIVQAFVSGGGSQPVLTLTSGLLFAWLPMLIIFTIIDRNPNSSERSA